jgi:hypothetical protein
MMVRSLANPPALKEPAKPPPRLEKIPARTNHELPRLLRSLVWGDMAAYAKRVEGLTAKDVRAAVVKYLDAKRACTVVVEPAKP